MSPPGPTIRRFGDSDCPPLWRILQAEFRSGESHPQAPDISESAAFQSWIDAPQATFVAFEDDALVGTYLIKPNQPGLGSHVCNCGYIVAHAARGRGIGKALCRHSLDEARRLGYRSMQYNLVVSTNKAAVALWARMGFATVGTLPGAFRHPRHGFVDAYVMSKPLLD